MEDPKKANETLQKLEDRDVRIIYLPPMTVAAARISGEAEYGVGPEATGMIEKFVYETESLRIWRLSRLWLKKHLAAGCMLPMY